MNDTPSLGISVAALKWEVERMLEEAAASKQDMGAVNWGDLSILDIQHRRSLLYPEIEGVTVVIEEADPGCALAAWLYERLDKARFPDVYFECEW